MQNELKLIYLRWISIFSDSESKYVNHTELSDFLSSHNTGTLKMTQMKNITFDKVDKPIKKAVDP